MVVSCPMQPTKIFGDMGTLLERESLFHIKDVAIWQCIMLQCSECIAAFRVHCCHHIFQIFLPLWDYYIEIQKPSNIKFKINHQTVDPGLYDKGYISIWLWHLGLNSFHGIWNCTTALYWCTCRHLSGKPCCNRTLWILVNPCESSSALRNKRIWRSIPTSPDVLVWHYLRARIITLRFKGRQ